MRSKIMLVEDHEDLREVTAEWLAMGGFEVASFETAEQALEALEARLPDALLTDLSRPGMSGAVLAERARTLSGGRPLLIIALTGATDVGAASVFDVVLTKPVDMDRLALCLRSG
jgi:CheY-like chemotaxis protein